ncbi:MAG TPA: hypothetical protein PKZ27_02990 [Rhodocyclaceae bacterium]|nr:hypothetical protein [Burkholderiaceae bacterium]HRP74532.1 hypothetical protein [Rhodocyclaceae bacterium]
MRLRLTNGYPYPYPEGLSSEEQEAISEAAGSKQLVLDGVVHFEWLHTVTVEFALLHALDRAIETTGWKSWNGAWVLEAPVSAADGYGHPAIIAGDTAYCGFILENK